MALKKISIEQAAEAYRKQYRTGLRHSSRAYAMPFSVKRGPHPGSISDEEFRRTVIVPALESEDE